MTNTQKKLEEKIVTLEESIKNNNSMHSVSTQYPLLSCWTLCSETILINAHRNWGKMADFLKEKTAEDFPLLSSRRSHRNHLDTFFTFFVLLLILLYLFGLYSCFYICFFIRIISPIVNCRFAYSHFEEPRRLPLRCHSHSSLPTLVLRLPPFFTANP